MGRSLTVDKVLAVDLETSGISFQTKLDPSDNYRYQILSIGAIVTDTKDFQPIEKFYIEIKMNGTSEWQMGAERIHGMSEQYLEENGVVEEEALADFVEFVMRHFDMSKPIVLLGHNVSSFDRQFLLSLMKKYDLDFRISSRAIDSATLALVALEARNSDEMFDALGLPPRGKHNALEDIEMTLKVVRVISKLMKQALEE
jgi:DNA polymerase III epsilon subunit-like protein